MRPQSSTGSHAPPGLDLPSPPPYHLSQGDVEGQGMTQRDSETGFRRDHPDSRRGRADARIGRPEGAGLGHAAARLTKPRPARLAELAEQLTQRIALTTRPMRRF
jgi:hypothetical protein